jgi:hypothetical protein
VGFQRCDISSIPKRKERQTGFVGFIAGNWSVFGLAGEERPTQLLCKVVRVGAKLSEKRARKKYPSRGTAGDAKGILLQVEQRQPDKMVDLVLRRSQSAETVVARPSEKGGPEMFRRAATRKWYRKCGGP